MTPSPYGHDASSPCLRSHNSASIMARVELEHVRKVYPNGYEAVEDASFAVEDGEFVVFVGPSGCGKSTLLRMIAGLEEITAGTLTIGDRVVADGATALPPKDRDIAMVFQNYALYPHMTVGENMGFGLKIRKFPKAEIAERVAEAARILGLEAVLDRKPGLLSGGQRQRVAVGRAIVRKPAVFLFDEPLSNLDAKLRVQMRTEIAKLHNALGATMIYVTHDQVEAMTMGDRIVVLKDGEVQQIDTPLALYGHPVNRFVAGFIGSPAMNFVEGRLASDGGTLAFVADGDALRLPLPAGYAARLRGLRRAAGHARRPARGRLRRRGRQRGVEPVDHRRAGADGERGRGLRARRLGGERAQRRRARRAAGAAGAGGAARPRARHQQAPLLRRGDRARPHRDGGRTARLRHHR